MQDVKALREGHKFPEHLIINMDETPIFFDMPKAQTMAKTGAREVQVIGTKGGEKRVTRVVTCSGAGQTLKPMSLNIRRKAGWTMSRCLHESGRYCKAHQEAALSLGVQLLQSSLAIGE